MSKLLSEEKIKNRLQEIIQKTYNKFISENIEDLCVVLEYIAFEMIFRKPCEEFLFKLSAYIVIDTFFIWLMHTNAWTITLN